jgi:hypothetical protein
LSRQGPGVANSLISDGQKVAHSDHRWATHVSGEWSAVGGQQWVASGHAS